MVDIESMGHDACEIVGTDTKSWGLLKRYHTKAQGINNSCFCLGNAAMDICFPMVGLVPAGIGRGHL